MDNFINNDAPLFAELNQIYPQVNYMEGTYLKPATGDIILQRAWGVVRDELADFLSSSNFDTDMQTAFGSELNLDSAGSLIQNLVEGEDLPLIVVAPENQLNGARGAFDSLTGTVYVTDALINDTDLSDVLMEELGHQIDLMLNPGDSPGDEGELFSRLVGGEKLSGTEILRLKYEDDRVTIFDGLEVEANQKVSFAKATDFAAGNVEQRLAAGDFNGDNIIDIVAISWLNYPNESWNYYPELSVFLGKGDGNFKRSLKSDISDVNIIHSLAVGEFNDDDILDLAVVNRSDDEVSVLLGKGNGLFNSATTFDVGWQPESVNLGDFNADGISDLAVLNWGWDNVLVLSGQGNGNFSSLGYSDLGKGWSYSQAVGEFNRDGILDLATTNYDNNTVSISLGNGDGSFSDATDFVVGNNPYSVAVGEFNGDGISDLAVANASSDSVSVLLGNGDGSFNDATNFNVGDLPQSVAVGEFNGDGISDLIVANQWSNNVSVLLGTGNGSFNNAINLAVGNGPEKVVLEDFNGDGKLDIATSNTYSDNVSILLNTSKIGKSKPKIAIEDASITEDNKGTKNAEFTVTLDNPSNKTVKVNYATANDTAKAKEDYKATKGIITFKPGQTEKTITVPIFGDKRVEGREQFQVNLSQPKNVIFADKQGIGTITDISPFTFEIAKFATGEQPESMAVADIDKDGFKDLVVVEFDDGTVSVLFGDGKGNFSTPSPFEIGWYPLHVAVGDFNQDGNSDVATTQFLDYVVGAFSPDVTVLFGKKRGKFSSFKDYPVPGFTPWSVTAADVNEDGFSDIVTANLNSDDVSVLLGTKKGLSSTDTYEYQVGGSKPWFTVVEDFSGDGKLDIVTSNYASDSISLLLGNGDGTFGNPSSFAAGAEQPSQIAAQDLNGDKKLDLVVANRSSDKISVMFGKKRGNFSSPINYPVGNIPYEVAIGDLNDDGNPDIVTTNPDSDNISVLLGKGKGRFDNAIDLRINGNEPTDVVIEDFNEDGKLDIAVTHSDSDNVSVLLNTGNIGTSQPPKVAIEDATITEGNKGKKNAKFTVTLDNPSDETVKVNYATANGTAKANKDYKPTKGTITFKPGQTEKTITVPIFGDTREEKNEQFKLNLSKPKNAKLGDKGGIGTIKDND